MATTIVRSTYALDVESVRALERMARRWKVSRSEALRRAIKAAAEQPGRGHEALQALETLQRSLALSPERARQWAKRARAERRASERRGSKR